MSAGSVVGLSSGCIQSAALKKQAHLTVCLNDECTQNTVLLSAKKGSINMEQSMPELKADLARFYVGPKGDKGDPGPLDISSDPIAYYILSKS